MSEDPFAKYKQEKNRRGGLKLGGCAWEGHPRQCQARIKKHDGGQCKRWALKGTKYCQYHGGRTILSRGQVRVDILPKFYRKYLNKTIQETLEEALTESPEEQTALFEELALMRQTVKPALVMWDAAMQLHGSKGLEMQAEAGALLRAHLKEVAALAESANRVMLQGKEHYSIHSLVHIVNQIVRIAYDVFEDDLEKAERFEYLVRERVKMPSKNEGVTSTPDLDVLDMDDTVPKESNEE